MRLSHAIDDDHNAQAVFGGDADWPLVLNAVEQT